MNGTSKPTLFGDGAISPFQSGPACRAKPEMPLSDDAGRVAGALQHRGQGDALRIDDERGVSRQDAGAGLPPRIGAGQKSVARRRTGRGRGMRVGKAEPFPREPVHIWRLDRACTIGRDVAVTKIVGVDEDDVRPRLRHDSCGSAPGDEEGIQEFAHETHTSSRHLHAGALTRPCRTAGGIVARSRASTRGTSLTAEHAPGYNE